MASLFLDFSPRVPIKAPWRTLHGPFLAGLCLLLASCSSWRQVQRFDSWTLYEIPSDPIDAAAWEQAFRPAVVTVESIFGPFAAPVAVHAWHGSVGIDGQQRTVVVGSEEANTLELAGVGIARIQAWHSRGGRLGSSGGIFIATPDTGTAVHELVHAHYSEHQVELPLWFEEGVASLIGDGALYEGRWLTDGLAYWPLRELRENPPSENELRSLLDIGSGGFSSIEDNVLVHFVGWAIVFDLYRETGELDWELWYERFDWTAPLQDALLRLERTLQPETELTWLEQLSSPEAGRRIATARGAWKVRRNDVMERLLDALEVEKKPEVRATLALNLLASTEQNSRPPYWRRMRRLITSTFRDVNLPDPKENSAMRVLLGAFLGRRNLNVNAAFATLDRFWSE